MRIDRKWTLIGVWNRQHVQWNVASEITNVHVPRPIGQNACEVRIAINDSLRFKIPYRKDNTNSTSHSTSFSMHLTHRTRFSTRKMTHQRFFPRNFHDNCWTQTNGSRNDARNPTVTGFHSFLWISLFRFIISARRLFPATFIADHGRSGPCKSLPTNEYPFQAAFRCSIW
jgi:hypothetical protein